MRLCAQIASLAALVCLAAAAALARADQDRPVRRAAVVPSEGALAEPALRAVTSELRLRLRDYRYRLVMQRRVRAGVGRVGSADTRREKLSDLAEELDAELVVLARVGVAPSGERVLRLFSAGADAPRPGPFDARIETSRPGRLRRGDLRRAVRAALREALGEPPPTVETRQGPPADRPGPEVEEEVVGPQPRQMDQHDEDEWHDADHEGFFGDLSFLLSWCYGDTLCHGTGTGYGGRLRLGYRILSHLALSVSGAVSGHNLPSSTDVQSIAHTDRALLWLGVFGGARGHFLNRSWFDPYLGLDLGWMRLFFTEQVEPKTAGEDCTTYMGIDLCGESTQMHNTLSLDGFALAPHAGINFFITRNVALGIQLELLVPFWSKACRELEISGLSAGGEADEGKRCRDVEGADEEFLDLEHGRISDEGELPIHLDLDLHLAFVF